MCQVWTLDIRQSLKTVRIERNFKAGVTAAPWAARVLGFPGVSPLFAFAPGLDTLRPGQPIYYVYDNQNILAEVDGSGNLIELFTHGPNIDEPLEIRQGSGTEYFVHADALGSVVAHTDGAGAVVEHITYEAYGQPVFIDIRGTPTVEAQSFTGDLFAFTGREYDPETLLHYMRARYYDFTMGQFLQPEPLLQQNFTPDFLRAMGVRNPEAAKSYSYAGDRPVDVTDPFGLMWNGNFWPFFYPQDNLCSVPFMDPKHNWLSENNCTLKCCQAHDACYKKVPCNSSSWLGNIPIPTPFGLRFPSLPFACQKCNETVFWCVMEALSNPSCNFSTPPKFSCTESGDGFPNSDGWNPL